MKYRPILIASTGRAGSTLLMKILASHPGIVVRSVFPYETRASQYYFIANQEQVNIDNFELITWNNTEYRPFQGNDRQSALWTQQPIKINSNRQTANLAEAYYHFVSDLESKPDATSLAEKLVGLSLVRPMINACPETKIIFLQRDPRDTFFSIKSFNEKRGYLSFGEEKGDLNLFNNLINFYKQCQLIQKKINQNNFFEIKYEDIVNKQGITISKLFENLDLNNCDSLVLNVVHSAFNDSADSLKHKTSSSVQKSLSRWQEEADKQALIMFDSFRQDLNQIGY